MAVMENNEPLEHEAGPPSVRVGALIVDELIRCGVREAVVCPGSRSAPLALALAEASRAGRIRLHVRTDERGAAFLALGMAKASGTPVPVVMTSGTAVANCLPAMVEATLTHAPLVVISSNRPWSYVGTGANQTIDQREIFGSHAAARAELDSQTAGDRQVRATVDRLIREVVDPVSGGGGHLDVPFVEPLVPGAATDVTLLAQELAQELAQRSDEDTSRGTAGDVPLREYAPATREQRLPFGQVTVDVSRRTLVIAGSVTDEAWAREILEVLADLPVLAEPMAPAPDFPIHSAAASMFTAAQVAHGEYSAATRPEQIIVVGRPTLHRSVTQLLADPDIDITVLTETNTVPDVAHTARRIGSSIRLTGEHPAGWVDVCRAISDLGVEAVRHALGTDESDPSQVFSGMHAVAAVADALRDGDTLVLGASSTVRDASRAGLPFDGVRTIANRGAAGIDGTIATAIGTALATQSARPEELRAPRTVAVLGDLTFIHDATSILFHPQEPVPGNLVVVVINDDGGAIFEGLEPGGDTLRTFDDGASAFERVFGTPTGTDLGALCRAGGVGHIPVENLVELAQVMDTQQEAGNWAALEEAHGADADKLEHITKEGVLVIEARVSRQWRPELERKIRERVSPR